jgi:3-oxoacyl-[acyl-carrier protein] reductase
MAELWELGPVLITVGISIAQALLEAGATTIVVGSSMHRSEVANPDVVKEIFATVEREFGTVAVLVNGAGINFNRKIGEIVPADFDKVMAVNVKATFFSSQTACERMDEQRIGGRVINISSGNYRYVRHGSAVYSASKAALEILTRSFALEYGRRGIAINVVARGLVERPNSNDETYLRVAEYYRLNSSQQRLVTAADVAAVCLNLASTNAAAIGGETVIVDGGYSAERLDYPERSSLSRGDTKCSTKPRPTSAMRLLIL